MMNPETRLEQYFDRLWPLNRSLAGPGYRQSLDILSEIVPFERLKFYTGEKVFDWTIPREWHVHAAYIVDPQGKKRLDVQTNNLHLLGYSAPFRGTVSREELKKHLYTLPEQPTAIPYMVSYYEERWGFCITYEEWVSLPEGDYQVVVDTELKAGHVEVGETVLKGDSHKEILFSSYLCHPSMANNELSGPLTLAFLYEKLASLKKRKYTYRFVINPESIGSIAYLTRRGEHFKENLLAGYVLTCIGDRGGLTFKQSRNGTRLTDRVAEIALRDFEGSRIVPYFPNGSDEVQYCSLGFDLPVGSLFRTMYSDFPEYHTSLDNKEFIRFEKILGAVNACEKIVFVLENNDYWKALYTQGVPFLSSRGVYPTVHSLKSNLEGKKALTWMLNFTDGATDLLAIAKRSGLPFHLLLEQALILEKAGLLERKRS